MIPFAITAVKNNPIRIKYICSLTISAATLVRCSYLTVHSC